jgi:hypothetical protein
MRLLCEAAWTAGLLCAAQEALDAATLVGCEEELARV